MFWVCKSCKLLDPLRAFCKGILSVVLEFELVVEEHTEELGCAGGCNGACMEVKFWSKVTCT